MLGSLTRTLEQEIVTAVHPKRPDIYAKHRWFAVSQNRHVQQMANQTGVNVGEAFVQLRDDNAQNPISNRMGPQ